MFCLRISSHFYFRLFGTKWKGQMQAQQTDTGSIDVYELWFNLYISLLISAMRLSISTIFLVFKSRSRELVSGKSKYSSRLSSDRSRLIAAYRLLYAKFKYFDPEIYSLWLFLLMLHLIFYTICLLTCVHLWNTVLFHFGLN